MNRPRIRKVIAYLRELDEDEQLAVTFNMSDNPEALREVAEAADALLLMLEDLTTDEFAHGGDFEQRVALRSALAKLEGGAS